MARPKGSKNADDDGNGGAELRNTVSGKELRDYIERIEELNEQQKEIALDRSDVFKELRTAGFDSDTVRAIIRRRKLTADDRDMAAALMDQYMSALGEFANTPLGHAGADRVRGEANTG